MNTTNCPRRRFLKQSLAFAAGAPLLKWAGTNAFAAASATERPGLAISRELLANAKVAIVPCKVYGAEAAAPSTKPSICSVVSGRWSKAKPRRSS